MKMLICDQDTLLFNHRNNVVAQYLKTSCTNVYRSQQKCGKDFIFLTIMKKR